MGETRIVNDTVAVLNRLQGVYAWRNNTGAYKRGRRTIKYGDLGSSDILCVYGGRFFGLEGKSPIGVQSSNQKSWQAKIEAAGGIYGLFRTTLEALAILGIPSDHPKRPSRRRVYPR